MQYILIVLEETNGERIYYHHSLHELPDDQDADEMSENYAKHFYVAQEGEELESGGYEFFAGEIIVEPYKVQFLSKEHFDILKKYL